MIKKMNFIKLTNRLINTKHITQIVHDQSKYYIYTTNIDMDGIYIVFKINGQRCSIYANLKDKTLCFNDLSDKIPTKSVEDFCKCLKIITEMVDTWQMEDAT